MPLFSCDRRQPIAGAKLWMASLLTLVAAAPTMAAASDGLDCHFTKVCTGKVCEPLDNAPMRLRFLSLGKDTNPKAISLADSRLLQGALLKEGEDFSILFGPYEAGSHPTVQVVGEWINSDKGNRGEIIISFYEGVQLAVIPAHADGAVLTEEGRGLAAFFGPSKTTGTCERIAFD